MWCIIPSLNPFIIFISDVAWNMKETRYIDRGEQWEEGVKLISDTCSP